MAYSDTFSPEQSYAYKHVSRINNKKSSSTDSDARYITKQNDLLKNQNQHFMGKITSATDRSSSSNITNALTTGFYIQENDAGTIVLPDSGSSDDGKIIKKKLNRDVMVSDADQQDFDPYFDYNQKKGLTGNDKKLSLYKQYVHIDSSARNTNPIIATTTSQNLPTDPLYFAQNNVRIGNSVISQNLMWINAPSHTLNINDKITLTGFTTNSSIYSSLNPDQTPIYLNNDGTTQDTSTSSNSLFTLFTFYAGGSYMRIGINPNMPIQNLDPALQGFYYIDQRTVQAYDVSDMTVTISGFQESLAGSLIEDTVTEYSSDQLLDEQLPAIPTIASVPVNLLDATHKIYLLLDESDLQGIANPMAHSTARGGDGITTLLPVWTPTTPLYSLDHFYIKLGDGYVFDTDFINSVLYNNAVPIVLTFNFNHFGGIPINKINAQYPIDATNALGYHLVNSTAPGLVSILLQKQGIYYEYFTSNNLSYLTTPINFGDSDIDMSPITSVLSGYASSSQYTIDLPNKLDNVVQVKLINTIFPNSSHTFTNVPGLQNNKLYWQNEDDGLVVYSISIDPGNYDPATLVAEIQSKIASTDRIYDTWDTSIPITLTEQVILPGPIYATLRGSGSSTGTIHLPVSFTAVDEEVGTLISINGSITVTDATTLVTTTFNGIIRGMGKIIIGNGIDSYSSFTEPNFPDPPPAPQISTTAYEFTAVPVAVLFNGFVNIYDGNQPVDTDQSLLTNPTTEPLTSVRWPMTGMIYGPLTTSTTNTIICDIEALNVIQIQDDVETLTVSLVCSNVIFNKPISITGSITTTDGSYETYNITMGPLNTSDLSDISAPNLVGMGTASNLSAPINQSYVTNSNFVQVLIDPSKSITTFKSFKKSSLSTPIIFVQPYIQTHFVPIVNRNNTKIYSSATPTPPGTLPITSAPVQNVYQIVFYQIYQTIQNGSGYTFTVPVVKTGDTVTFSDLSGVYTIPSTVLNAQYVVYYVDNILNTFSVITKPFNTVLPQDVYGSDGITVDNLIGGKLGGVQGNMFIPNNFRLLFNYSNTMGRQIGFRNVGDPGSITGFASIITNNGIYDGEITITDNNGTVSLVDPSGNVALLRGNSINLSGNDYLLMSINQFPGIQSINTTKNKLVKNIFAKVNLSGLPGTIVYDTFVSAPIIFNDRIDLSSLSITFYDKYGNIFDFNGLDHSFVLEFLIMSYVPLGTNINTSRSLY